MTTINPLAAALAALFDQSLQAAVASSRELDENEVRDLVGRVMAPTVDRLDGRIDSHAKTIAELHYTRLAALEARLAALESEEPPLRRSEIQSMIIDAVADDGRPMTADRVREIAQAAAEAALDEHTSSYDHDDYDAHVNDDDKHPEGDLEEKVREVIDGLEITLSL